MNKLSKKITIALISLAVLLIILLGGFYIYTLDYYRADVDAIQAFSSTSNIQDFGDKIVIFPDKQSTNKIGFIFYPGGKVEATAYIPLLQKLSQNGITCVLVKMPFNLAVFNANAAANVYDEFKDIKTWYLGGHSLGGAMASSYVGKHADKLEGLILLGAYPINNSNIPTLAIYGSEDMGLDKSKLAGTENKLEIKGGNHAYFGNYGEQKGDGVASITREEQQSQAENAILQFIQPS